jgi:membrane protein YqaA with SNARE-associated domain
LDFLRNIFERYTDYIKALVAPLGPWAVFVVATIDAAFMGIPMDPMVAAAVYNDRSRFWMYILMASVGSALGSIVVYYIGLKGEELLLEKRIPKATRERLRASFERHEFFAVMVPAMLPPPTPFKLVVLTAGALKVRLRHFLLAIFAGRLVRFGVLSVLVLVFGQQVMHNIRFLFREHLPELIFVIGVGIGVWLAVRRFRRKAQPQTTPRIPEEVKK